MTLLIQRMLGVLLGSMWVRGVAVFALLAVGSVACEETPPAKSPTAASAKPKKAKAKPVEEEPEEEPAPPPKKKRAKEEPEPLPALPPPAAAPAPIPPPAAVPAVTAPSRPRMPACSERIPEPRVRGNYPDTVAGFRFGMTVKQAVDTCTRAGFEFHDLSNAYQTRMLCEGAPIGMDFPVTWTRVGFCKGQVCGIEMARIFSEGEDDAEWIRFISGIEKRLNDRYGAPDCITNIVPSECNGHLLLCIHEGRAHYNSSRYWDVKGTNFRADVSVQLSAPPKGLPMMLLSFGLPEFNRKVVEEGKAQGL
jgi:hypothetical protein